MSRLLHIFTGRRRTVVAVGLAVLAATVAAWAYWAASGSGSGTGTVGSLLAPSISSATPGAGTVSLTWTAVSAPGAGEVRYYVRRDGGAASAACPSSASPSSTTSCTDTGVSVDTHTYTVTAVWRSWTAPSESASATVAFGPATHLALTAATTTPTAGSGDNLTITAKDAEGNTVGGYTGTKTVTFGGASTIGANHPTVTSSSGVATSFGNAEQISFSNGVASVSGSSNGVMTLYKAEAAKITVTDGSLSNGSGLSVTVGPAAAASFSVTNPGAQTAGTASEVGIAAKDEYGNTATGYSSAKTITFSGPASSPNGKAPSYPASVTFAEGTGTATITLYNAATTTLTAKDGTLAGSTGSFTVNPAPAATFSLPTPGTQTAGKAFEETFIAKDEYGNTATGYSGAKTISFSGPASSPNGKAPSYPSSVTFSEGTGTATITLYNAASTTLTAKDGAVNRTTGNFTVGPAAAASFSLPVPATQTAGKAFEETITAKDEYGNTATGYTGARTISFSGPSESPNNSKPSYPATVSFTEGIGTASITLFDAQSTTLTAKEGTITGTCASFTVNSASATSLSLTAASITPSAGEADNLTITAFDAYGNTATGYTGSHSLTFGGANTIGANKPTVSNSSGTATAFGTATSISFTSGSATVSGANNGVMKLYGAETAKITVSDGTIGNGTGLSVTVAPAAIASIAVTTPGTQTAGSAFNLSITAKDTYGNGVSGSQALTFSGPTNSPNSTAPTYPSTVSFTNGSGTASVTLTSAQSTTITVKQGAVSGTSGSFTVNPATAASLSLSAASTTPNAGAADNLTITALDSFGNTATSYTASKSLTFGGASTIGANKPTVSNSSGTATAFGTATSISFTSGSATVSGANNGVMKLYKAETAKVTVSDGSIGNGTGLSVTVSGVGITSLSASGGAKGRIDAGDSMTAVFSGQVAVSSMCSAWSGNGTNQNLENNNDVTVTVADGTGATNDSITVASKECAFHLGTIDLGSNAYVSGGNVTFSGTGSNKSKIKYTASTFTLLIELGGKSGSGTAATVSSSVMTLTPDASLTDAFGNPLAAFSTGNGQQF